MKIELLAAAAMTGLFAGAAMAADMPVKPVAPAAYVQNWTGCYVGGNGGALMAEREWFDGRPGVVTLGETFGKHSPFAAILGLQAGCDVQFGYFVAGIQADYGWTDAHDGHRNRLVTAWGHRGKIDSVGTATARLGFAFDRFLGYVKGGYAWENDKYEIYQVATNLTLAEANETRTGWVAGFGGEMMIFPNVSAFIEGNFFSFGKTRTEFQLTGGGTVPADIQAQQYVARAGLNWRFGGAPVVAKY